MKKKKSVVYHILFELSGAVMKYHRSFRSESEARQAMANHFYNEHKPRLQKVTTEDIP